MTVRHAGLVAPMPGAWAPADSAAASGAPGPVDAAARASLASAREHLPPLPDRSMWIARPQPGQPVIPAVALVTARPELSMAPALGTSADAVLAVMEKGLARGDHPGVDAARRIDTRDSRALAISALVETGRSIDDLTLDYFVARPGTKQVVWVRVTTPMSPIRSQVEALFDRAVRTWHFANET